MAYRMPCGECKKTFENDDRLNDEQNAIRTKDRPDCNKCRVDPINENIITIFLYEKIKRQRVGTAMGSIGALDMFAIDRIIEKKKDIFYIEDTEEEYDFIEFFSSEIDRHTLIGMENKRQANKK